LNSKSNFEELQLWGKVCGLKADYFVAIGYTHSGKYEFPTKTFYWCSSNSFKFEEFPELNNQHKGQLNSFKQMYSGDPNKKLIVNEPEKAEGEEQADDGAQEEEKEVDPLASSEEEDPAALIVPRNFLEIDRLHYFVRSVETDCHLVPQGSYKLTTTHEVHRNESFTGLKPLEAFNIQFYSHFRNCQ
jgi:radial spoke head protein 9